MTLWSILLHRNTVHLWAQFSLVQDRWAGPNSVCPSTTLPSPFLSPPPTNTLNTRVYSHIHPLPHMNMWSQGLDSGWDMRLHSVFAPNHLSPSIFHLDFQAIAKLLIKLIFNFLFFYWSFVGALWQSTPLYEEEAPGFGYPERPKNMYFKFSTRHFISQKQNSTKLFSSNHSSVFL